MGIKQGKLVIDYCECGRPMAYFEHSQGRNKCYFCRRENHDYWNWMTANVNRIKRRKKALFGRRNKPVYRELSDKDVEDSQVLILPTDYHSLWFKAKLI